MTTDYTTQIAQATALFAEAMLAEATARGPNVVDLDSEVQRVLREVGLGIMHRVLATLGTQAVAAARAPGLRVDHRIEVTVATVFGPVTVESPYLWRRGQSARPVKDVLGLRHGRRSQAVERALTDFGAEDSFGLAVKRFEEHYGWPVGRTTALRVVEARAHEAEAYVTARLARESAAFEAPLATRPGVDRLLVELDGSELRTGVLVPAPGRQRTPVRRQRRRQRREEWREVRVGLARRLDEVDRTYVARLDIYPVVVGQLFEAAVGRGLSSHTEVIAVGDGGNGLREELAAQLPNLRFILDRPHLKQHLYEAAEAIGLNETQRHRWVAARLAPMERGHARHVIAQLARHQGRGKKRVARLVAHLRRFADAVHYDAYRAAGLPTGSGEVESAHRYIPQKRLKLPGACWHPDTINPMLALRVLRANDWWGDFWATRSARAVA